MRILHETSFKTIKRHQKPQNKNIQKAHSCLNLYDYIYGCVPTHAALPISIVWVLASQLYFLANRNAELAWGNVVLLSGPTVYSVYCAKNQKVSVEESVMRPVTKGGGGSLMLPFFITKIAGYAAFFSFLSVFCMISHLTCLLFHHYFVYFQFG